MRPLGRLLSPAQVAFVGGDEAATAIRSCEELGFTGEIWPVNPSRETMAGRACFPSIDSLPAAPDAAFIAVPREVTVELVGALAKAGAGGAVCYASGFAETGPAGEKLQQALVRAAGDMPLLGPNCYGFINAVDGVALWPDVHGCEPVDSGVALLTQSSNIGLNLTMQLRHLPMTHVITVGNQAGLGFENWIDFLLDDPRVKAIGLHLESLRDSAFFGLAAGRALAEGVPLVVLKTGNSAAGAAINRSHTAALAGAQAAYRALFDRYGVYSVNTIGALLQTLGLLNAHGTLRGNRLASLSCSGGEASLIADRAVSYDVAFPPVEGSHLRSVASTLPSMVTVTNPLDYHTFHWGDRRALTATFTALLKGPYDAGILLLDFPTRPGINNTSWWASAEAMADASLATGTPAIATASLTESMPLEAHKRLRDQGLAVLHGIDETLTAIEGAAWIGARAGKPAPDLHTPARSPASRTVTLDEATAKARLRDAGIAVPAGRVVPAAEAASAAQLLGFPIAVKAVGLAHKTETRSVRLDLTDGAQVAIAAAAFSSESVLVEQMMQAPVAELLVGIRPHPAIGYVLTVGAGGTMVELLDDTTHLLLPCDQGQIEAALAGLRVAALLAGHRGAAPADVAAAVDHILATAHFVLQTADIVELEINPLFVFHHGAVAVDALMTVEASE